MDARETAQVALGLHSAATFARANTNFAGLRGLGSRSGITSARLQLPNVTGMLILDLDDHPELSETAVTKLCRRFAAPKTLGPDV